MSKVIQFDRNGETGNIFYIIGQARKVLHKQGQVKESHQMFARVNKAHNFDEALKIIGEYVELEEM